MNPWQMAQQIKHKLKAVVWPLAPSGTTEVVFGDQGVTVFAGTPTEEQIPPGFPWCLVGIGTGTADEDSPDLLEQQFALITGVDVAGDPMGEHSIIGGAVADLGKSVGRGIAEVAARVRAAVENLTGADGARIMLSTTSIDTPSALGRGRHLTIDEHTMTAICTSDLQYSAPQVVRHDLGEAEVWNWEGAHCSNRFDFVQYRLVRKAGITASTDPTDGTVIYTGTAATTTQTATSGFTYTVFADYSSRKQTSVIEGSSSAEVGSYLVF